MHTLIVKLHQHALLEQESSLETHKLMILMYLSPPVLVAEESPKEPQSPAIFITVAVDYQDKEQEIMRVWICRQRTM